MESPLNMASDSGTSGVSDHSMVASAPVAPNTSAVNKSATTDMSMMSDEPASMVQYNMSHSSTLPTFHESELELDKDHGKQTYQYLAFLSSGVLSI